MKIKALISCAVTRAADYVLLFSHNVKSRFSHDMAHILYLAHLSQRLTGELIVYPWSGVLRRLSVVLRPSVVHNAQTSSFQKPLGRSKHLSQRLTGELIVYPWSGVLRRLSVVLRPSVVHNAQTSSFQKPLGRSKPNLMWSLLR